MELLYSRTLLSPPSPCPPIPLPIFKSQIRSFLVTYNDSFHRPFPNTAAFSSVARSAVFGGMAVFSNKGSYNTKTMLRSLKNLFKIPLTIWPRSYNWNCFNLSRRMLKGILTRFWHFGAGFALFNFYHALNNALIIETGLSANIW